MSSPAQRNTAHPKWETVKLNSCFALQNGVNFSAEQKGSGLQVLDVLNMFTDDLYVRTDRLYRVDIQVSEDRLLRPGDILFVRSSVKETGVGWPAIFRGHNEPVTNCGFLIRARQTSLKLDPRFIVHYLRQGHIRAQMISRSGKVAITNINQERLGSLEIPLPPLPEQRRIAEVLDRTEALRAKRRAALAQLDTLTQAMFLEMFGDPVLNSRAWPIKKLSEVGQLDRGVSKHRPRNAPELLGGPYPLVQTGDIANCEGYVRNHISTYSEIGLRQSKIWPAGTLCITIAANIAKTGILTFDACFPDSVVGFRADEPSTVEFVRSWLSFLQKRLEDSAPESAQKNINLAILRDLNVPLPPLELQHEFARRVAAVEKLKTAHRASLAELDALFAALQHRAFRGEL